MKQAAWGRLLLLSIIFISPVESALCSALFFQWPLFFVAANCIAGASSVYTPANVAVLPKWKRQWSTTGHNPCASCRTPASSPRKPRFRNRRARGSIGVPLLGSIPANFYVIKNHNPGGKSHPDCGYDGGSDGNRTHVRKHFHRSFSERSFCFKISRQAAPKSRLCRQLSR